MPNIITALQVQKKNKERVNVFLDGEFVFGLHITAAAALTRGQELSAAEITVLKQDDERHGAYQRALRFLGYRPRSRAEIEKYLGDKGYPAGLVAEVVERLVNEQYIDDEAFSRFWVENRNRFRPRGARALRYELRQKGVERDDIDAALEAVDDEAAAWDAVAGKLERWQALEQAQFMQKVGGFLARRGFSYDTVRQVSERAWKELHP